TQCVDVVADRALQPAVLGYRRESDRLALDALPAREAPFLGGIVHPDARSYPSDRSFRDASPDARKEPVPHLLHVGVVARELSPQEALLEDGPARDDPDEDESPQHSVPGTQQQRRAHREEGEAGVHGMTHEVVWTDADDLLRTFGLDPDGGRQERVLAKREEEDPERRDQQKGPDK